MTRKIPEYLARKSTNVYLLVFVLFFSLIFVNVYTPFEFSTWFNAKNDSLNFLYSTYYILGGIAIMSISRIVMHFVNKKELLSILAYVFWLVGEILVIVMLYTFVSKVILDDHRPASDIFQRAIIFVPAILFIPYVVSYLFIGLKTKDQALNTLLEQGAVRSESANTEMTDETINFKDEKGKYRLSIKKSSILYIEANDNYVNIYYLDNDKVGYTMLRNNLKSLEDKLKPYGIVRCHRSYMVNLHKIKMISREKEGVYLTFDEVAVSRLPLSKSYSEEVMQQFSSL